MCRGMVPAGLVPRLVERLLQIPWQRRAHRHLFAGERMVEREPRRVEELTLEPQLTRAAVDRIAGHRKIDCREMDADLMGSTGLQTHVQQSVTRKELDDLEVRDRLARRLGVERPAKWIAAVAADRCLDAAATRPRPAHDEREVMTLERP